MVGYGENTLGFFMLEGKAEVVPNENNSKIVYFDLYNKHLDDYDESEEEEREQDEELAEMNRYLRKKRLLSSKIGKLKFVRYYMPKPEIKKRRKRTNKAAAKAEEDKNETKDAKQPPNTGSIQDSQNTIQQFIVEPTPSTSIPPIPPLNPSILNPNPFCRPNFLDMSSLPKEPFMNPSSPNFVTTPNFPHSSTFFTQMNSPLQSEERLR